VKKYLKNPVFKIISETAETMEVQAFVIGGFVRDCILNRSVKDIDIVVPGSGIELAKAVAKNLKNKPQVTVFKHFGTAAFKFKGVDFEFVGARKESYSADSRKPFVESGTLEDDQNRRDFTINALAVSLNKKTYGELTDPFGGLADIENKIIRTPLDPDITFSDDPLRMMRAVRFAAQLDFVIESKTFLSLKKNKNRLEIISHERISDELNKIILSPVPSVGFKLADKAEMLNLIFPELTNLKGVEEIEGQFHKDNFYHTLKVLDNIAPKTDNLWLRWAALLHDIGKPTTKKFVDGIWTFHAHEMVGARMVGEIFRRMKLPMNEKMKYVEKLVRLHLRPIALASEEVSDSAVRRLLFDAGNETDDLMTLCEADITSKNEEKVKRFLENFQIVRQKLKEVEEKDKIRNWQPPITGDLIINTFGMNPCKDIGIIKDAVKDAILDGIIENTYQAAFDLMIREAEKLGYKPPK
jgi:poly(A) polymerase